MQMYGFNYVFFFFLVVAKASFNAIETLVEVEECMKGKHYIIQY